MKQLMSSAISVLMQRTPSRSRLQPPQSEKAGTDQPDIDLTVCTQQPTAPSLSRCSRVAATRLKIAGPHHVSNVDGTCSIPQRMSQPLSCVQFLQNDRAEQQRKHRRLCQSQRT